MHSDQEITLTDSLSRHLRWGAISLVVLLGGGLTWAVCTNLSGAVIATGVVAVEGSVKTVQHPTGGVVAELLVKEGQTVAAGDVLLRLDATLPAASQAIVSKSLSQAWARLARLEAERDNAQRSSGPQRVADPHESGGGQVGHGHRAAVVY